MRPVLTIIAAFALSGVAFAEEKPGKPALAKTGTLEGVVIEKHANVKSYEAWNSPSDPYYVLDIGDVTETYKDGEKTWQETRKRHVTLRPSPTVSTADLAALKGKQVTLRGHHTEGEPYKPTDHAEQIPMEPVLKTKPDSDPEIVGSRPANRGAGFVVEAIVPCAAGTDTPPAHSGPILELTLSVPPPVVAGQPSRMILKIKNVSTTSVNLPWPRFIDQFVTSEIKDADGTTRTVKHQGGALGHGRYPGGDLKPGATSTVELSLTFPRTGVTEVRCILEPSRKATPWWSFWEGRVESNTVKVDVSAAPGATSVDMQDLLAAIKPKLPEQWEVVSHESSRYFFLFLSHKKAQNRDYQEGVNDPTENISICDSVWRKNDKPLAHWRGHKLVIWGGGKDWPRYREDILSALDTTKETRQPAMGQSLTAGQVEAMVKNSVKLEPGDTSHAESAVYYAKAIVGVDVGTTGGPKVRIETREMENVWVVFWVNDSRRYQSRGHFVVVDARTGAILVPHAQSVTAAVAQPIAASAWLGSPRFTPFPARYAAGDWEHEVRFSPVEGAISPYELIIRYRGQAVTPSGWCDWVFTPWGIARSFNGRWIPGGAGLGGRNEMLGLTQDELSRGKDLTPQGSVVKPATQPNDTDRLADCLRALNNPARQVQLDAARYLGRLGPGGKAGVGRLTQMVEQFDPGSIDVAGICMLVEAIGRIGPDARSALPLIVKLSGHRDPNVRTETVWAVARVRDFAAEATPFLERMAQDKEERVVRAAISALEQVKNKALRPAAQPKNESASPGARADKRSAFDQRYGIAHTLDVVDVKEKDGRAEDGRLVFDMDCRLKKPGMYTFTFALSAREGSAATQRVQLEVTKPRADGPDGIIAQQAGLSLTSTREPEVVRVHWPAVFSPEGPGGGWTLEGIRFTPVLPTSLSPPIEVTAYEPLDCGATELLIKDKTGQPLYLFNKPFRRELFLSTKRCTDEPDMRCSVHITKGHPLQKALIASLEQFLKAGRNAEKLEKVKNETDFTKLTEEERILQGSFNFLGALQHITETADKSPEPCVAPANPVGTVPRKQGDENAARARREIPAKLDSQFRPEAGVEYTLAASSLYRHVRGSDPGPAERDTSIAWTFANEFVYRTALANEYVVPAGCSAGPTKDGWCRVSFSAKDGKSRRLVVEVDVKRHVGRLVAEKPAKQPEAGEGHSALRRVKLAVEMSKRKQAPIRRKSSSRSYCGTSKVGTWR